MEKDKVKIDETIESIDIMRKRDALQTTWAKVNIFFLCLHRLTSPRIWKSFFLFLGISEIFYVETSVADGQDLLDWKSRFNLVQRGSKDWCSEATDKIK